MSLLIIADSQVERVWRNVRQNREMLRTATYIPVKRIGQLQDGVRAMTAQVIISCSCCEFLQHVQIYWLNDSYFRNC